MDRSRFHATAVLPSEGRFSKELRSINVNIRIIHLPFSLIRLKRGRAWISFLSLIAYFFPILIFFLKLCAYLKRNRIHLIEPLEYELFVYLMNKAFLILTDSGGIHEDAPSLGKPVLIMREVTERPEAVEAGTAKLVGTKMENIVGETQKLLDHSEEYQKMTNIKNPYGDGKTSERILNILASERIK